MTLGLIAHAVGNELGGDTGGTPGDQTGLETRAAVWYKYPRGDGWIAVYRARTAEKRETIARFMEDAVCNGYLGYNQNRKRRREVIDWLEAHGYNISELDTPLATDCGGLVYAAVFSAYRIPATNAERDLSGRRIYGVPTTGLFDEWLMNDVGDFDKYTGDEYTGSAQLLERGDILLASGHVGVWI